MNPSPNPLWQDILKFSKNKKKMAVGFILLGLLGLVLPIIPGFALVAMGFFYLKPEWYEKFRSWLWKDRDY
jgi:hypothetical protein